jgi:hypothetical protein
VPLGALAVAASSSSSVNDVEPGVLGFLIVAAMGVALVFLLRSMNKQFRKITPEPGPDPSGATAGGESAGGESAGGKVAGGKFGGAPADEQAADRAEAPK